MTREKCSTIPFFSLSNETGFGEFPTLVFSSPLPYLGKEEGVETGNLESNLCRRVGKGVHELFFFSILRGDGWMVG